MIKGAGKGADPPGGGVRVEEKTLDAHDARLGFGDTHHGSQDWSRMSSGAPARRAGYLLVYAALLACCWPSAGAAMNDTDGVFGRGVFPIAPAGVRTPLVIDQEWVEVRLVPGERHEVRRYALRNTGEEGSFEIGWVCAVNAVDALERCYRMTVDGKKVTLRFQTGRLRDPDYWTSVGKTRMPPPRVERQETSPREVAACLEHVDGTICGQSWASAQIPFGASQTRVLQVESREPISADRFLHAVPTFRLHAERYFRNPTIPKLELRFHVEGGDVDPKPFPVRADLVAGVSSWQDGRTAVWSITDFPVQEGGEPGYYGRRVLELSGDGASARQARTLVCGIYERATGQSIRCRH